MGRREPRLRGLRAPGGVFVVLALLAGPGAASGAGVEPVPESTAAVRTALAEAARAPWWEPPPEKPLPEPVGLAEALLSLYEAAGFLDQASPGAQAAVSWAAHEAAAQLDPRLAALVAVRVGALASAVEDQRLATAAWTDDDLRLLHTWYWEGDGPSGLVPAEVEAVLAKTRVPYLIRAADTLLAAHQTTLSPLKELPPEVWPPEPLSDPFGVMMIGTTGHDAYGFSNGRWLSIDPGGDDEYFNNGGGANPVPPSLTLLVRTDQICAPSPVGCKTILIPSVSWVIPVAYFDDLAGDDVYWATGARSLNAHGGAAPGSVALLVDEGGSNAFASVTLSQGAGFNGVGILHAAGTGAADNDTYTDTGQYTQGAARAQGVGILYDDGGDDTHTAPGTALGYAGSLAVARMRDYDGTDTYAQEPGASDILGFVPSNSFAIAQFLDEGGDVDTYPDCCSWWGNDMTWRPPGSRSDPLQGEGEDR